MYLIKQILWVGAGGFGGSIARFLITGIFTKESEGSFPLNTFLINIIGSFLVGILAGILANTTNSGYLKLFLIVGFCGGFTTFSAFSLENIQLLENGFHFTALTYILLSIITGILAVAGGLYLSKLFL